LGLAAGLVGTAKYYLWLSEGVEQLTTFRMVAIIIEIILIFNFYRKFNGCRKIAK
jgi:hypothetical protein